MSSSPAKDATPIEVLPPIKLDQFLKLAGIVENGADAKALIASGAVSVNGEVCTQRGRQLSIGMIVEVAAEVEEEDGSTALLEAIFEVSGAPA